MDTGISIGIEIQVDGRVYSVGPLPPPPSDVRIADDGVDRITDNGQYRIID
jgi:hypothetical protein